ncbi:Generic methyltransferase [Tritrichomonas foetus]|uniref:Generic methyltransferase n=1 Tax=Tritrichomonas foetus TaxID=1144522 RepID=A0A1J4KCH1_9EUKA|nr:Generic methyltransferase [Tritrichomonas foetus]|eukprot:OHT09121.1 Generic methyltransferase [Tritrichomonas foetus]
MQNLITKDIDLSNSTDVEAKRAEILDYFLKTWEIDELIYKPLKDDEVFLHRGDPLRHVILFYYGHTAAFYINKMMIAKIIKTRINPEYESIFAIGVDEMSWDDLNNQHYNWPTAQQVREYREKVKEVVIKVIKETPLALPITWESPFWIIMMGIEHSRIHLETSSVLIRQLPINEVVPDRFGPICTKSGEAPINELISVPGGTVKLGKPFNHHLYGWDNEYGELIQEVKEFKASKYLVSNGEFLEFVKAGGYQKQEFWTEEGWNWRTYKKAEAPLFWIKIDDNFNYKLRLIDIEIPMPWNWPVELNYLEAKAFCNWKAKSSGKKIRMPTEAEWYRLHSYVGLPDLMEWKTAPGNINLEHYASPCPVNEFQNGDFYDVIGNVWQWCETTMTGYPGFKVHPIYDDFTTPTMDGKHNMIKGGSFISTGNEATIASRYAFRRHFYQHAGFRYIESEEDVSEPICDYEDDPEVTESCEFNWGDKFTDIPSFQHQLFEKVKEIVKGKSIKRVLDLNADTGRLPFELATEFEDITALDFSARFIKISIQLQEQGVARYMMKDEGDLVFYRDINLKDFNLTEKAKNILFMQADANNIKTLYTGYDLIIVPNLLEEISYPDRFLKQVHERLNANGTLIIASTFDWNEKKTNKEHWLGGFKKDGENVTSFDGMKEILSEHFNQSGEPFDMNFVVKKSSRVSELRKTQVSVWNLK